MNLGLQGLIFCVVASAYNLWSTIFYCYILEDTKSWSVAQKNSPNLRRMRYKVKEEG